MGCCRPTPRMSAHTLSCTSTHTLSERDSALNTHHLWRILGRPESLLNYYLPAIFVVEHLVSNCTWALGADGSCMGTMCVLQRCVGLLVDLAGRAVAKMDCVRTVRCALLYNAQWHDDTPGATHVVECCEALLAKLRARCKQHPDKHMADEADDFFRTMPPRQPVRATDRRHPNQQFDVYTPIIVVRQMSRLCRAQLCPPLSFEGLYYWFLLL